MGMDPCFARGAASVAARLPTPRELLEHEPHSSPMREASCLAFAHLALTPSRLIEDTVGRRLPPAASADAAVRERSPALGESRDARAGAGFGRASSLVRPGHWPALRMCQHREALPLFGKRAAPLGEEERQAAAVDLERIARGGIPLGAEQRLKRIAAGESAVFTSDLSAKEYAVAHASGLTPIAQIMGSSVVQHGWQNYGWSAYQGGIAEMPSFAAPWNLSRERSFDRLRQEAQFAGADAVIGIEMTAQGVPRGAGQRRVRRLRHGGPREHARTA